MNKAETLKMLNKKIDKLIIDGKTKSPEFKRLCDMHWKLALEMGLPEK